jgi:hypothetical protein
VNITIIAGVILNTASVFGSLYQEAYCIPNETYKDTVQTKRVSEHKTQGLTQVV